MDLGRGFNTSILFMLAVMLVLVGGFVLLVRGSYRSARRAGEGEGFQPAGKVRWDDPPS